MTDPSKVLGIRLEEQLRHIRTSFIVTATRNWILTHFFSVSIHYIMSSKFRIFF